MIFWETPNILRSASLLLCPRVPTKPFPSPAAASRMQSSSFSVSDQPDRSRGKGRGFDGGIERERTAGRGGRRGRGGSGADKIDALGRLLTRILRHMASELNLDMRSDGYIEVQDLRKLNLKSIANIPLQAHSVEEIKEAVRKDNKQRFSLLEENGKLLIRANQGHTLKTVESDSLLKPILLADEIHVCVHGTYKKNVQSILDSGLKCMQRLHMHFSPGLPTDGEVISGMRQNVNVLIFLDVRKAFEDGMKLYISDNGVILTEGFDGVVPVKYFDKILSWPDGQPIPFLKATTGVVFRNVRSVAWGFRGCTSASRTACAAVKQVIPHTICSRLRAGTKCLGAKKSSDAKEVRGCLATCSKTCLGNQERPN